MWSLGPIDQMFTVLILIKAQLGGEGFVITLSTMLKWSICLWCFGKGFVGFNFIILCTLKIIYKDVDTLCDILKSELGVWVFLVWSLCELNVKTGFFLSLVIVLRVQKLHLAHVLFYTLNAKWKSGQYGDYKWLESLRCFILWSLRLEYIWIGERGYHYTHSFGSSEQIKNLFRANKKLIF